MSDQTKNVYSLMQDIFKNVWEQQKYSEAKNGILLTLNIAVFALVIRAYFHIESSINKYDLVKLVFIILVILFIWHIYLILKSFFPKDSNKEDVKLSLDQVNIFFFGDIQKLQSNRYLNLVIKKLKINENEVNKDILLDLSNQIIKLSEITQMKYKSFKDAFLRMYIIGILYAVFFLCIYYEDKINSILKGLLNG